MRTKGLRPTRVSGPSFRVSSVTRDSTARTSCHGSGAGVPFHPSHASPPSHPAAIPVIRSLRSSRPSRSFRDEPLGGATTADLVLEQRSPCPVWRAPGLLIATRTVTTPKTRPASDAPGRLTGCHATPIHRLRHPHPGWTALGLRPGPRQTPCRAVRYPPVSDK